MIKKKYPPLDDILELPIKGEIYSTERLEDYAIYLAEHLQLGGSSLKSQPLLRRVKQNGRNLLLSYRVLAEAGRRKEEVLPAAEWLIDNFHIVEEQLREVFEDLPVSYYKQLPKISEGALQGYPRIYAIALALIAHTDSRLSIDTIRRVIKAFQTKSYLNMGELWAVAITLRLALLENLRRVSSRIIWDMRQAQEANQLADHISERRGDLKKNEEAISRIAKHCECSVETELTFIAQLAKRFRDPEEQLWPIAEAFENNLKSWQLNSEQIVDLEHQHQAANQVTIANIISSMRLLSNIDWKQFFESVSLIDRSLEKDPQGVYESMDFVTRDEYRHSIERIARATSISELDVSEKAIEFARMNNQHVGYYLKDRGVFELEAFFFYRPKIKERFSRAVLKSPTAFYLLGLLGVTALLLVPPLIYASSFETSVLFLSLVLLLVLLPAGDLAVGLWNFLLTHVIRPQQLAKMDFSKGVPQKYRTLVVVPCMLSDKKTVHTLLEHLEAHYLGNTDEQVYFSLLTDFKDAESEEMPTDDELLTQAREGIERLNRLYSSDRDRFFLFHRHRLWNKSEKKWMGWERKRGKLEELNNLLRGAKKTSFSIVTCPEPLFRSFKYVITLDADTQLGLDSARKLIGVAAHPLNIPHIDERLGRVTRGYGLIQPRVSISLESSSRSTFAMIFSGHTGIDPYTTAVSDVYQDLFGEGNFTGKGLYDIDVFRRVLQGRVPENTILSHDLFEGLFARTGLATDIELLDDYPSSYRSVSLRQHRWVRGDWQIAQWVLPWVPTASGALVRNSLPMISRWKIYDNLRRSLVSVFLMLFYLAGWFVLPGDPWVWSFLATMIVACPCFLHLANGFFINPKGGQWTSSLWNEVSRLRVSAGQFILSLVFLPHRAMVELDAIVRALFRLHVSKIKSLEWMTAAEGDKVKQYHNPFWMDWKGVYFFLSAVLVGAIFAKNSMVFWTALPFLMSWYSYPIVETLTEKRLQRKLRQLNPTETKFLQELARRIWFYFETYVGDGDNWLPPDNVQEEPEHVVAHRTSPTNIGLYGLSVLSAFDFGFISVRPTVERLGLLLKSIGKLERYRGHLLNWYDTQTLEPLYPRYVSAVDSGNLAGYLLVIKQGAVEIKKSSILSSKYLGGIQNTLDLLENEVRRLHSQRQTTGALSATHIIGEIHEIRKLLQAEAPQTVSTWSYFAKNVLKSLEDIEDSLGALEIEHGARFYSHVRGWTDALTMFVRDLNYDIELYTIDLGIDEETRRQLETFQHFSAIERIQSLEDMGVACSNFLHEISLLSNEKVTIEISAVRDSVQKIFLNIESLLSELEQIIQECEKIFTGMEFSFLLDPDREVFSIGYNVNEGRLDNAYYDLLASECRLASFLAIAKRDTSAKHWFRLGRQLVPVEGGRALISWSASMFEYLMPNLVMKNFDQTLLGETARAVVKRQVSYGRKLNVPWGVSEAGYNARDLNYNYQYGPFGIPGLGLKRGLGHDLVISPYSTFLAALIDPLVAVKNLFDLDMPGVLTRYGFIEAIDYTPDRLAPGQSYALIRSYMAHHQGMSLVALDNILNFNVMPQRFHKDARVRAAQLLLQERIPQRVTLSEPKAAEIEWESAGDSLLKSFSRVYDDSSHHSPRVQILSNGHYSLMLSTAGSGYSKLGSLAVSRWREDTTRDHWGSYIFLRDLIEKKQWSSTLQPNLRHPDYYKVVFAEDKVEFLRRDETVTTFTQVIVAPEDNIELRQVTLTNSSPEEKVLEVTSYLEPILAPLAQDLSHPAFSNLFLQTEYMDSKQCLLAKRRPRSSHQKEMWAIHGVMTDSDLEGKIEYETDRSRFVGRGRDLTDPVALQDGISLSGTIGSTLDPVLSLRVKIRIPAGGTRRVIFKTGCAFSREDILKMADRYHDVHSFEREGRLAWTKSKIDLRHLGMDPESAYLFQRLAERLLYSDPSLRHPSHLLAQNTREQASLWPYGISGDVPIVVLLIGDKKDMSMVRKVLRGHEYLRLKGLSFDLVLLNESKSTYMQELQEELLWQIRYSGAQELLNKLGGIFTLRMDAMPERDRALIQAMAHVVLSTEWGTLKEQLARKVLPIKYAKPFVAKSSPKKYKTQILPKSELLFFNGLGGFSSDGKEYIINLQKGQWPPAPWINVIANAHDFGFQVSESGSGFTWSLNSRENRLTPWSNDAVSDPPGEVIYLRDEDTGEYWCPTPRPCHSEDPYRVRHGQGYTYFEHATKGLFHSLLLFVPPEDSVKISVLEIKNTSGAARKLSVWAYVEWVLGNTRERSAPYVFAEFDNDSKTLFAKNSYNHEFANRVAFFKMNGVEIGSITCDRKEFLGRNRGYAVPEGLLRQNLSGFTGMGQDPCGVLQAVFDLQDQEQIRIVILLGQADSKKSAQDLVQKYSDDTLVAKRFQDVEKMWESYLGVIQVKTPDISLDLMLNRWSLYQAIVCRLWARSAFYQSGGAYGFRDQLQDCMAFVYAAPELARVHILRACSRQFPEGDVQHWWHPPSGRGVRTHFSDDLLWLPFVVAHYIRTTGDSTILAEHVSFIEAPLLAPEQEDSYTQPKLSEEKSSLLDHCLRAIQRSLPVGDHGLPFIGCGDWNDGMNRVGEKGRGESVWMGWFLYKVLHDFMPFCNHEQTERYRTQMQNLKFALEQNAWDGEWYRRAYFDDGTPLGTAAGLECKIDSLSQSWSVLSGAGDPERQRLAMKKVSEHLILPEKNLIMLLTPPFDKTPLDPGYIKGYVPGVRENGGQYTHAAIWVMMAYAELQDRTKALELYQMINPLSHTRTRSGVQKYKIEPYAVAADVYGVEPHVGRGGWSWYTGSASWFYRAGLETLLGFRREADQLIIKPCVPESWLEFEISYRFKSTLYVVKVKLSQKGALPEQCIPLKDVGGTQVITLNYDGALDLPGDLTDSFL